VLRIIIVIIKRKVQLAVVECDGDKAGEDVVEKG